MATTYKNIDKTLIAVGDKVIDAWMPIIDAHTSSGELKNSIRDKVKDQILVIEISENAIYLDGGRSAGTMPPISALERWASSKGLNVWAVATNIKKFGTEAHPFLNKYETIFKDAKKQITKAGGKDIEENSKKILDKQKNRTIKLKI